MQRLQPTFHPRLVYLILLCGLVGCGGGVSDLPDEQPTDNTPANNEQTGEASGGDANNSTDPGSNTDATTNSPGASVPLANAGSDQYSYVGASITLNGSASSDADGDELSYHWSLDGQPTGSNAGLNNPDSATPSLIADQAGHYLISLEVSDGAHLSNIDSVTINVANWIVNNSNRSAYITSNGIGVLENIQSLQTAVSSGIHYLTVSTGGIPDYRVTLTQAEVNQLNSRPKARSDFYGGATSARAGDEIAFGQNLGYKPTGPSCSLGYWPPGPACPSNQNAQLKLPTEPVPAATTHCSTSTNTIGLMLNGTSVFNWQDGQSYNSQHVWNNLAPVFEQYDVDICQGHAQQQGNYHHHMFSACLQDLVDDTGNGHSPIYGFAADGYPIYGPYYMQGILAKPSWVKRDYAAASASGCGSAGVRSCQLVDQYDLSKGTKTVTAGPTTSGNVTTQSGNTIAASSGIYFEDYYYAASLAAMGGEYLDQHNGHNHDGLGYHYHITAELVAGKLQPLFPYQVGPTFYGKLPAATFATCGQ